MTSVDLASTSNSSSQSSLASFKHNSTEERHGAARTRMNDNLISTKLGKLSLNQGENVDNKSSPESPPQSVHRGSNDDSTPAPQVDDTCRPKPNKANKTSNMTHQSSQSSGEHAEELCDEIDQTVVSGDGADEMPEECPFEAAPLAKRIDFKQRAFKKNRLFKQLSDRLYEQQMMNNAEAVQQHQQQSQSFDLNNKTSLIVTDDENPSSDKINPTKVSLTNSLTDVNEDLINEKNNEIGRVTKWATGFEKLLEDPLGLQIFTEFLKKEFSEENIDFWVKCENFKKLSDPEEMKRVAQDIWNIYLDTSSMRQINVDNKARSICKDALQQPNNTMFETAQTQIFALMKYDSYSRFLKSQMYKDCIVNEMEGKPLLSSTSITSNSKFKSSSTKTNHHISCDSGHTNRPNHYANSSNAFSTTTTNIMPCLNNNTTNTSPSSSMPNCVPGFIFNDLVNSNIPNASSNIAAAVAVVATTGAAVLSSVHPQSQQQSQTSLSSPTSTAPSPFNLNSLPSSSISIQSNSTNQSSSPLLGGFASSSANMNAVASAGIAISPSSASSLTATNLISTGATGLALSSGNLNSLNNSNTVAGANANSTNGGGERKEKKRSTIIPWTKAFIKWKRLSGKDSKKAAAAAAAAAQNAGTMVNPDALPVFPAQSQTPTLTSGVAATLVKGLSHKTPLILSNHVPAPQSNNSSATVNQLTESNILQTSLELSNLQPSSLSNHIENKFCRVLCNDGSSTMIQVSQGTTVYQALTKIFNKKQIPWYKCDIYFVSDYQPVDQQMDSQSLGSKEIYLEERCLFALSLIPIAINICVKANLKKSINSVLQPILDAYQIKNTNCAVYLNSANYTLNLSELCSSIDSQHVLVVHKHQSNLLSQMEIEKFMSVSIADFIPANFQDYQMQFDDLGILKKCVQIKQKTSSTSGGNTNSTSVSLSTSPNSPNILNAVTAPLSPSQPTAPSVPTQIPPPPPLQSQPAQSAAQQQVPQAQIVNVQSGQNIQTPQAQLQLQHIRLGLKSVNEEQEV